MKRKYLLKAMEKVAFKHDCNGFVADIGNADSGIEFLLWKNDKCAGAVFKDNGELSGYRITAKTDFEKCRRLLDTCIDKIRSFALEYEKKDTRTPEESPDKDIER